MRPEGYKGDKNHSEIELEPCSDADKLEIASQKMDCYNVIQIRQKEKEQNRESEDKSMSVFFE